MSKILIYLNFFIQIIQCVITASYDRCDSTGLNASALILNTLSGSISGFCSNISINYGNKPISSNNQVLTWLSIPYAEPPIGNLRFKYPRPKKSWAATLDGTKPSSQCIQSSTSPQANEDCLYLNAYVPYNSYVKAVLQNNRASKLAIYIWIHGGGFINGSAKDYDGSMLAAISNLIVVTIQYRLGAFGFLYVNGTEAIGNLALLDQNLALKWVYSNADRLGGDRQRITIGGESSGGRSVGYHLIFKASWPYFSGAVIQSGSPIRIDVGTLLQSPDNATLRASKLGATVGCKQTNGSDLLNCLQSIDADEIKQGANSIMTYPAFVFDLAVINQLPQRYFETGDFKKCNLLIGYNNFEEFFSASSEISDELIQSLLYGNMTALNLALQLRLSVNQSTADQIIQIYVPPNKQNDSTINYYIYFNMMITDFKYKCPTFQLAEYATRYNSSVYAYMYSQGSSVFKAKFRMPPVDGAVHTEEIPAVFGDFLKMSSQLNFTNDERVFGEQLVRYWGNFITMSKPSLSNEWPSYMQKTFNNLFSRNLYNLRANLIRNTNVFSYDSVCKFWNSLILSNYS